MWARDRSRDYWWAGRESNPHSRRRLVYSQRSSPPAQPTHCGSGTGSRLRSRGVPATGSCSLGADDGTRTRNRRFTKPLLYQLSYVGATRRVIPQMTPSAPGNDRAGRSDGSSVGGCAGRVGLRGSGCRGGRRARRGAGRSRRRGTGSCGALRRDRSERLGASASSAARSCGSGAAVGVGPRRRVGHRSARDRSGVGGARGRLARSRSRRGRPGRAGRRPRTAGSDPATAALSEPIAPRIGIRMNRSQRRRTAGPRPWPSLPTTIASGPRRSVWRAVSGASASEPAIRRPWRVQVGQRARQVVDRAEQEVLDRARRCLDRGRAAAAPGVGSGRRRRGRRPPRRCAAACPTFCGSSSESRTRTNGGSPRSAARARMSSSVANRRGSTTSATPWWPSKPASAVSEPPSTSTIGMRRRVAWRTSCSSAFRRCGTTSRRCAVRPAAKTSSTGRRPATSSSSGPSRSGAGSGGGGPRPRPRRSIGGRAPGSRSGRPRPRNGGRSVGRDGAAPLSATARRRAVAAGPRGRSRGGYGRWPPGSAGRPRRLGGPRPAIARRGSPRPGRPGSPSVGRPALGRAVAGSAGGCPSAGADGPGGRGSPVRPVAIGRPVRRTAGPVAVRRRAPSGDRRGPAGRVRAAGAPGGPPDRRRCRRPGGRAAGRDRRPPEDATARCGRPATGPRRLAAAAGRAALPPGPGLRSRRSPGRSVSHGRPRRSGASAGRRACPRR